MLTKQQGFVLSIPCICGQSWQKYPVRNKRARPESRPESGQSQARVRPESGQSQGQSQVKARLDSIRTHLLEALKPVPLSRKEIAGKMGHKTISGAIKIHISEMLKDGLIEYVIPEKPNSRLQKYRLTEKGATISSQKQED